MPSVDGEESGEEEVERSPNEGEHMSEDDEVEDSSSSGSEDSSSDSIDEVENERRRVECLDDMADLERQFTDLKEQLYQERVNQVEQRMDEISTENASEYNGPLLELSDMCQIRIEVAGILRNCRLKNINHKYDADEQAAKQHFESEKVGLLESMRADMEEKIRKLEEDKHNMDISADLWIESQSVPKKQRRTALEGPLLHEKRRKPVTVSGPYIVYMLKEMDILEDWAAIRRAKGVLARQKAQSAYQSEHSPYSARYEDGKLCYQGEWFHKGSELVIESRDNTSTSAVITGINTGEVWARRTDGTKTKLYISHLQKGKYKIKKLKK